MSLANFVNTPPAGALSRGVWKRRRDSSSLDGGDGGDREDGDQERKTKLPRCSYYVTLESESPQPTDEDDESIYSLQGKETDYVKDTSDTSTHTWVSSSDSGDVSVHVEYEVASLSETEDPFPVATSTSDPDDIVTVGVIAAFCDSDLGLADNSDDSRSSVDSEIGTADYWTCVRCNTSNNNPLFRYCEKCYQSCWQCRGRKGYGCFSLCETCFKIRKNFFPPRPKWRRRRSRRESANGIRSQSKPIAAKPQELVNVDSGLGSSQESKLSFSVLISDDAPRFPSLQECSENNIILNEESDDTFSKRKRSRVESEESGLEDSVNGTPSQSKPIAAKPQEQVNVDSDLGSSQESKLSISVSISDDAPSFPSLQDCSDKNIILNEEAGDTFRKRKRSRVESEESALEDPINGTPSQSKPIAAKPQEQVNVDSDLGLSQESKLSLSDSISDDAPSLPSLQDCSEKNVILNEESGDTFSKRQRSSVKSEESGLEDSINGTCSQSKPIAAKPQDLVNVDSDLGSSRESKLSLSVLISDDAPSLPSLQDCSEKNVILSEESGDTFSKRKRSRVESEESGLEDSAISSRISELSPLNDVCEGDDDCRKTKIRRIAEGVQEDVSETLRKAIEKRAHNEEENKWCIVCTTAPRNGAFVHKGKIHCCCCYPCALKVWKKTKNCPICRRKVKNVHKIFYH